MSKIRVIVSIVIAILILVIGFWRMSESAKNRAATAAVPSAPGIAPAGEKSSEGPLNTPSKTAAKASAATPAKNFPASGPSSPGSDMITEIITSPNAQNATIVDQLLTLLPNLNAADQAQAAKHIANLSDDQVAARWIPDVVSGKLPAPAAEVLFDNLANRPPKVTLPALAAIADNPNHPKHEASIDMLSVLYDNPEQGSTWSQVVKENLQPKSVASAAGQ